MDDDMINEIEDIVGDVRLTDSQKSVTTAFSGEYTDSTGTSDKHNSSGKRTYVIDDDSDASEQAFTLASTTVYLEDKSTAPMSLIQHKDTATKTTSVQRISVLQEIHTQTSKTIMELALENRTQIQTSLETQTSYIEITNKSVNYQMNTSRPDGTVTNGREGIEYANLQTESTCKILSVPTDATSKYYMSLKVASESDKTECDSGDSCRGTTPVTTNGTSKGHPAGEGRTNTLDYDSEQYSSCSEIEDDSLMEDSKKSPNHNSSIDTSDVPKSVDNEVDELYKKLSETINQNVLEKRHESLEMRRLGVLTPLTEESNRNSAMNVAHPQQNINGANDMSRFPNKNSSINMTQSHPNQNSNDDKDVVFINKDGFRVKLLPSDPGRVEDETVKLPPIQRNYSCPSSPQLNFLFAAGANKQLKRAGTLSCLLEGDTDNSSSLGLRSHGDAASAESPFLNVGDQESISETIHLPPIGKRENNDTGCQNQQTSANFSARSEKRDIKDLATPISVKEKIKELKYRNKGWPPIKHGPASVDDVGSTADSEPLSSIAEKGCEALCSELLHRLRSTSWFEISETLQDIPRSMEKFWSVLSEYRTADLIRLVIMHLESPRTLVSRAACHTLADIIKNTKYTKKPDFYEAVSTLLVKTGCFSRAVKRAANVALDEIVCHVDYAHALTALCLHGVHHKSALVRCAAARLLVVSCAVTGAGRRLLRTKPARAATARQLTLQAMAKLLDDKCADARKYAERLYLMLRPQPNFEAFYLTDVDIETATRQMKKYDHLLSTTRQNNR